MVSKCSDENFINILPGIDVKTRVHGKNTLMSEFRLQSRAELPAHQHVYEQTGYLVSGKIVLFIGSESFVMTPGDSWCIDPEVEHKAEVLEDSVALEIFSPSREDYLKYLDDEALVS